MCIFDTSLYLFEYSVASTLLHCRFYKSLNPIASITFEKKIVS